MKGEILELKNTINTMVDQLNSFATEVTRVAREVGTEGKLGGQAQVRGVAGTWKDLTDNVNLMAANLTGQVRNIADVTTAVAKGDLSKKITVDVKGEILALKNTINTMVDQLNAFAGEVTRVAREVGTEGKLGGQAAVPGVGGTWKDLTDNVNLMATNLTNQVRGIAEVVTAVAQGNLKRKLTVDAKGEIAALADTINFMIDTLSTFGDQVTNMAREVGIEGKLGGQARVPGAAGLWRDLTDNVNQLAANLTNQVRSIAEVATAVTKGDLTRSIAVQAAGEMAALKDTINEMIGNLKDQTLKNAEQDWLKTNLARFSRMLQGERDLATVSNLIMSELAPLVNAQYGVFYVTKREEDETKLELVASYGAEGPDELKQEFRLREGLIGQAAADRRPILLKDVPPDFIRVGSGLGHAKPANVNILPALFEDEVKAVIELASFNEFNETHQNFLDQLMELVGIVLEHDRRDDAHRGPAQAVAAADAGAAGAPDRAHPQAGRASRDQRGASGESAAAREREEAGRSQESRDRNGPPRARGESRAARAHVEVQVGVPGQHEPRAAHAAQLAADPVQAAVGQRAGQPQREAGRIRQDDQLGRIGPAQPHQRHPRPVEDRIRHSVDRDRRDADGEPQAAYGADLPPARADKALDFNVKFDPKLPQTIRTDEKRLQQIVLNLLSNAFKFTVEGRRHLRRPLRRQGLEREPSGPSQRRCARSRFRSPTPASAFRKTSRS